MKFGQFDIKIYEEGFQIPEKQDVLYLVADRIYMYKKFGILESLVEVQGINHLPKLKTFGRLNIPKIPKEILAQIFVFFKRVYETYKSEAGVRIFFNQQTQQYFVDAPKQKVSGAQVDWENSHPPEGFMYIGTFHSHVTMSAFHSGTDKSDESKLDGIHIVFGNVDTDNPSIIATIVINGNRFKLDETDVLKHLEINVMEREEAKPISSSLSSSVYEDYAASKVTQHNTVDITAVQGYKFKFNLFDIDLGTVNVPQEWFDNIIYQPDTVYKFVDGKLVKCSKYQNNYVPSETKYLPAPAKNYDYTPVSPVVSPGCLTSDDTDYYPYIDLTICPKCRYREVAIMAMENGQIDDLMLTTLGYYGLHSENTNRDYELSYDSNGNMVDIEGNIIISRKELEAHECEAD